MSVLDYDPAGMEAVASSLLSAATSVMLERSRLDFPKSSGFAGPAADRFFGYAKKQVTTLDATYGALTAAAAMLSAKAGEVRLDQQAERARLQAIADAKVLADQKRRMA